MKLNYLSFGDVGYEDFYNAYEKFEKILIEENSPIKVGDDIIDENQNRLGKVTELYAEIKRNEAIIHCLVGQFSTSYEVGEVYTKKILKKKYKRLLKKLDS